MDYEIKKSNRYSVHCSYDASLISGCGGRLTKGRKKRSRKQKEQQRKICLWQNIRRQLQYIWAGK